MRFEFLGGDGVLHSLQMCVRHMLAVGFVLIGGLLCKLHAEKAAFIFRMDDWVLQADGAQDSIWDVFRKHGIPLSLGVIPFDSVQHFRAAPDEAYKVRVLNAVEEGTLELVLHGFSHTAHGLMGPKSEFADLRLLEQKVVLEEGKGYIENHFGVGIKYFAPPWNTYDANTLLALKALGFEGITADLGGVSASDGLAYLPATKIDFDDWDVLLKQSRTKKGVVVVLFHSYSFKNGGFTIDDLDSCLARLVGQGNRCFTFSGYTQQASTFPGFLRFELNAKLRYSRMFFFVPNRAQRWVYVDFSFVLVVGVGLVVIGSLVAVFWAVRKGRRKVV